MINFQVTNHNLPKFIREFPITTALFLIWTILYAYTAWTYGWDYNEAVNLFGGIVPAKISQGEYWRLLTYGYLHNGWAHFLSNVVFLYFFAPPLEKFLRTRFFLIFHFVTIIAMGLATS